MTSDVIAPAVVLAISLKVMGRSMHASLGWKPAQKLGTARSSIQCDTNALSRNVSGGAKTRSLSRSASGRSCYWKWDGVACGGPLPVVSIPWGHLFCHMSIRIFFGEGFLRLPAHERVPEVDCRSALCDRAQPQRSPALSGRRQTLSWFWKCGICGMMATWPMLLVLQELWRSVRIAMRLWAGQDDGAGL